jgi:hypothetical protein
MCLKNRSIYYDAPPHHWMIKPYFPRHIFFEPNSFLHSHFYIYIDSLNPRGQISIFKTLEMRSLQTWQTLLKFENQKFRLQIWQPTFSEGWQKLTEALRMLYIYLFKDNDGRTLKVRQSWDAINKRYLEHFEKLVRRV